MPVVTDTNLLSSDKPTTVNLTTGTINNAVVQGSTASLVCLSDGFPEPTYTFGKGSTALATGSSSNIYTIPGKVALSHEGDYSCTPENEIGDGPTVTMKLTVQGKLINNMLYHSLIFNMNANPVLGTD